MLGRRGGLRQRPPGPLGLAAAEARPDVVVLLPWNAAAPGRAGTRRARRRGRAGLLAAGVGAVAGRLGVAAAPGRLRLGDPRAPGLSPRRPAGGPVGLVRELNAALRRRSCPPGAYFLDLEQVSGTIGRDVVLRHAALLLDQAAVQRGGHRPAGRAPLGRRPGPDDRAEEGAGARPGQHALGRRRRRDRAARRRAWARAPRARRSAPSRSTPRSWPSAASSWPSPRRTTRPTPASRSRRTPTWS